VTDSRAVEPVGTVNTTVSILPRCAMNLRPYWRAALALAQSASHAAWYSSIGFRTHPRRVGSVRRPWKSEYNCAPPGRKPYRTYGRRPRLPPGPRDRCGRAVRTALWPDLAKLEPVHWRVTEIGLYFACRHRVSPKRPLV